MKNRLCIASRQESGIILITCLIVMATLGVITALRPLAEPVIMPKRVDIDLEASPGVKIWGAVIVAVTVLLYVIFR